MRLATVVLSLTSKKVKRELRRILPTQHFHPLSSFLFQRDPLAWKIVGGLLGSEGLVRLNRV